MSKAPRCIEEGCDRRTAPRQNWHTMSDDLAAEASPYHHRCRLHYARWLCRRQSKLTKARKNYICEGCGQAIRKGDLYNLAFRTAFLRARYPERVHVCVACFDGDAS